MHLFVILLAILLTATMTLAVDFGNTPPAKPANAPIVNTPDPTTIRQGGDTTTDAFPIPDLPFETTGTTLGYTDDYDEVCPYNDSTSPDVVYSLIPRTTKTVDIDLCGSSYDTKVYVYDQSLDLVACNDDFYGGGNCGQYVSKLEGLVLDPRGEYYVVIDGWGGEAGDYVLAITEHEDRPCPVVCSPIAMLEGEPPLVDDYDDTYNCGCNCLPDGLFQDIPGDATGHRVFCGVSGWYQYDGSSRRDTDWFHLALPAGGTITFEIEAEMPTYIFEVDPYCSLGIYQNIVAEPCETSTMTFTGGTAPWTVRIIVIPTTFEGPPEAGNEYTYELRLSGLETAPVTVQSRSWTAIKSVFR